MVRSADIRNGQAMTYLYTGVPHTGICFSRGGDKFLVGQFIGGAWYISEYNYPAMTWIRQLNVSAFGAAGVQSVRYSPNDRYWLVSSTTRPLIIDTRTMLPVALTGLVDGNTFDVEMTNTMFAVSTRYTNHVKINIVNNGVPMNNMGSLPAWDVLTASKWNWQVDEENPECHFLLGGFRSGAWHVTPYRLGAVQDYAETNQWDLIVREKPIGFTFSEVDTSGSNPKESFYGRAFAVIYESGYEIFGVLNGERLAGFTSTPHAVLSTALWKEAQGLYL